MQLTMAGEIDVGPTGSVTLFPTSNVKVAFGDTANMQYTLTEVELNRITAGDTLTIGSGEVEMLWVSGIQSARTGATKIVASKTGAAIVLQKEYDQVSLTWSKSLSFGGALTLEGGDGVFVNDSLSIGGAFVVDANADNLGGNSFYCINGNKKVSCTTDADCGRNLCSDGVTFCDGGQVDCTGTVCNVPTSWGSCVSKGEFRLSHNLTIATGGMNIKADTVLLMPQSFPWHTSNASIGGYIHAHNAGGITLQPKTARGVRLGQLDSSITYWRGTDLLSAYSTTFAVDQRTIDAIQTQGSMTIGNAMTSSITITGLTFTASPGYVSLVSTYGPDAGIAMVESSLCSSLPTGCKVEIRGPLYLTTVGFCNLLVDISVFFITPSCDGPTVQTGTLNLEGTGIPLEYIAVGDVVISGDVINRGRMTFKATRNVNISSHMTCSGTMTIMADTDGDGDGSFTLAGGKVLTSNHNPIVISASDINIGAKSAGTSINAGVSEITVALTDAAEIGLNAAASGMSVSADELSTMSCRNLTIGGQNHHVRIGPIPSGTLDGVQGFVIIRALTSGAHAYLGVEGASSLTFPALDLEVAGNITVYTTLNTVTRGGPTSLRLAALGITLSSGIGISSAGDLFLGHYSGENGKSPWGAGGIPRIGELHVSTPVGLEATRHLALLSHIMSSGSSMLQLTADSDRNLEGTVIVSQYVQVYGVTGASGGTLFISGNDFKVSPGAMIHMDQGDLLVTATDFGFASAPECFKGASLSMESVNEPQNQHFISQSSSSPGSIFFEPVPTSITKISSYVTVLNRATKERGAGRGRFSPSGGDLITVSGSAFGPQGSNIKFSVKIGHRFCALSGSSSTQELVPISGIVHDSTQSRQGGEGERINVWNVQEYTWALINSTIIRRFSFSFSLTCALPPGSGESLDFLLVAGWCGAVFRERALLGYSPPVITSILPASVAVGGPGGKGVLLTLLGTGFDVSNPAGVCHRMQDKDIGVCKEEDLKNSKNFAAYVRDSSVPGKHGNVQACSSVTWTSGSLSSL
jgi:hypothetical protein